jgi:hypothetical protein
MYWLKLLIMERRQVIYWSVTGAICFFMLFSAYYSGTHRVEFEHMGFPNYFRIELTAAKVVGVVALLIPQMPGRIKEWIYAGFGICLISACIAKFNSGYSLLQVSEPIIVLVVMLFLLRYLDRLKRA